MRVARREVGAALLVLSGLDAAAQPRDGDADEPARVEIVGSHLKRVDREGPTPVSTYRHDDIVATGATRLSEFLLALPLAGAGSFDDRATAFNFATGAAALSLRGLGPGATLVLLNGRRLAAYGLALDNDETFVDLNSLPLAAVDRVEVLRDGASAIYGADAIGGVVNIVLRRDFAGVEASGRIGQSSRGDSARRSASASFGVGDLATDRYNAFVTIDALQQDAVGFAARAFSRSADQRPRGGSDRRSPGSFPPTVRLPGADPMAGPGCPPEQVATFEGVQGSFCMFDPNRFVFLLPRVERVGVLTIGSFAPLPALRLYAEGGVHRTRTVSQIAPSPIRSVVAAAAPTNPFGADAAVNWRPVDAGPRRNEITVDSRRLVVGAEGGWRRWDWNVDIGTHSVRTRYALHNQLRTSAVQTALEAGTLDPFSASNDAAALAAVKVDATDRYEGRVAFVQAKASTEVARLPGGAVAMAAGVEHRRERFATELDPLTIVGDLSSTGGAGTANAGAARNVDAVFVEFNLPAARDVEIQLAARHDRYGGFGSHTSPKLAARWRASKTLLLRASAGRGFLPPSLQQQHKPRTVFFDSFEDPIRCPVTQSIDDCGGGLHSQQGNPQVKPERSRQANVGLVLEPVAGLTIGIDAWRIEHLDKIAFGDRYILANEAQFPGGVPRNPPTAADLALGLPGTIIELHDSYVNLASRSVRGVDVEMKARLNAASGIVTLDALASRMGRFVERVTPQDAPIDKAGGDGLPRWRAQIGASWQRGPWQIGAGVRFIGRYRYAPDGGDERTIASWTVFDLSAGWRGKRDHVVLGVQNVADRAPPMRDSSFGYDPAVHDPLGRFLSLAWRHSF